MKTHGGRSFLHGHLFGDNVHEYLAPCIYEGEGEMLGMAFFKSLVKEHGKQFFEPIGKALQAAQISNFNPMNPLASVEVAARGCGPTHNWSMWQQACLPRSAAGDGHGPRWPSTSHSRSKHSAGIRARSATP